MRERISLCVRGNIGLKLIILPPVAWSMCIGNTIMGSPFGLARLISIKLSPFMCAGAHAEYAIFVEDLCMHQQHVTNTHMYRSHYSTRYTRHSVREHNLVA